VTATHSRHIVLVEVEEALGPGLDYGRDLEHGGIVVRGARGGGLWLGADRGSSSTPTTATVARCRSWLRCRRPASSGPGSTPSLSADFRAARASCSWRVCRAPRCPSMPFFGPSGVCRRTPRGSTPDALRSVPLRHGARSGKRRGRGRITGGLAWRPPEGMSAEALRSGGVYSKAERSLDRLPPRFLRGLEGMLDPDERLHYSIERPWRSDAGLLTRVGGGRDHRSGLLLLTDREVLWLVDHTNPDSFLFDWGVDVDMVPIEQLTGVRVEDERDALRLVLQTQGGRTAWPCRSRWRRRSECSSHSHRASCQSAIANGCAASTRPRPSSSSRKQPSGFASSTSADTPRGGPPRGGPPRGGSVARLRLQPRREGQRQALGLWLSPAEVGVVGPRPERLSLWTCEASGWFSRRSSPASRCGAPAGRSPSLIRHPWRSTEPPRQAAPPALGQRSRVEPSAT